MSPVPSKRSCDQSARDTDADVLLNRFFKVVSSKVACHCTLSLFSSSSLSLWSSSLLCLSLLILLFLFGCLHPALLGNPLPPPYLSLLPCLLSHSLLIDSVFLLCSVFLRYCLLRPYCLPKWRHTITMVRMWVGETYMIMTMNIKSNKMTVRRITKKEEKPCWIVMIIAKVAIDDCWLKLRWIRRSRCWLHRNFKKRECLP